MPTEITVALIASGVTFLCWLCDFAYRISKASERSKTEKSLTSLFDGQNAYRSFANIKKHIGGYTDDELRRMLLGIGAIRVYKRTTGEEMWVIREIHEGISRID